MSLKYIKDINKLNDIDIIIPSAGIGKRMKSFGPKSLIGIKPNLNILQNQINTIKKVLPTSNIILVCGFESQILMNNSPSNIIKIENEKYETTNVVRSIGMGLRASSKEVLIIYGDLVFNEYCLKTINFNRSSILVGDHIMNESEVGCIFNKGNHIESMMYDLPCKWGQMIFLKDKELSMFKEICWNPDNYNMFGFEAINLAINNGANFLACQNVKAKVIDIDNSKDLTRISEII